MPYGVGSLLIFGLLLFCLIDVIRTDEALIRGLPKLVWVLLIVFLPLVGGIAWLVAGRPEGASFAPGGSGARPPGYRYSTRGNPVRDPRPPRPDPPRRSIAPDDDPDFLRRLDERLRRPDDPAEGDR